MNAVIEAYAELANAIDRNDEHLPGDFLNGPMTKLGTSGPEIAGTNAAKLTFDDWDKVCKNTHVIGQGLCPDDDWDDFSEGFAINAFKDLSVIKNPIAMRVFRRIADALAVGSDCFLFASKITEREDGSVVLVLQVSDLVRLEEALDTKMGRGRITEGMMIYRG